MVPEPLDDLLDSSGPRTAVASQPDIDAMIAEARVQAPARRRVPRVALGIGLAALLVGGTGVAVAADRFEWGPWAQDPVAEYSLTLPSGLDCAVRIAHYTATDSALADTVNGIVANWWRDSDVANQAAAITPGQIDEIRSSGNVMFNEATGEDEPAGYGTKWYNADLEYYFAFAQAISEIEHAQLRKHGINSEMLAAGQLEGGYGIQCLDENGEVTGP